MRFPLKLLVLLFLCLTASTSDRRVSVQARQSVADSDLVAVQKTVAKFIDAFTSLDWQRFRSFFASDATAFFPPSAHFPRRANGKAEIENVFRNVFEAARKGKSNPPYLIIQPKETNIQMVGDVAIVTFHLEDPDMFGRRTIVLHKTDSRWLIVHLHASGTALPK